MIGAQQYCQGFTMTERLRVIYKNQHILGQTVCLSNISDSKQVLFISAVKYSFMRASSMLCN